MSYVEHADKLGVDADELLLFYRGLGPKPVPLVEALEESEELTFEALEALEELEELEELGEEE